MRSRIKILNFIWMCIAVLSLSLNVSAYEYEPLTTSIPMTLNISGVDGSVENEIPSGFEFKLIPVSSTSEKEDIPVPECDSAILYTSGIFEWQMQFKSPGDYVYRIFQKELDKENWSIDKSVYEVTVRVTNSETGELESQVWAVKNESESKTDKIEFINSKNQPAGNVPTFDKNNIALWCLIAGMGIIGTIVIYLISKRRNGRK